MKKLFMLLAVAGVMVACNSAEDKAQEKAAELAGQAMDQATELAESFM